MTRRGRQMVLFLLFSFFPVLAFAITDEEIFRNFQFSFVNPGARSSGMGNAFVGLADDATAAEANPAGLTILTKPEVSFEYRHVTFDPDKLNSVNNIPSNIEEVQASSQNNLSPINQATFFSFVYPTKAFTFAFSRQGAVRLHGSINEVFHIIPGAGLTIDFKALGHEDEKVVNWNFSVARKLMKRLAAGATLRYSQLSWNTSVQTIILTRVGNVINPIDAFDTSLTESTGAFALNAGFIYNLIPKLSIGAVYKRNGRFEATETEMGPLAKIPGPFPNVLKIPDTFALGISMKPNDIITVSADIVRIQYSDLLEGFRSGYNFITRESLGRGLQYNVNDASEFHAGAEYYVVLKNTPVALRAGYYRKPSNALEITSTAGLSAFPLDEVAAKAIFAKKESENHVTIGSGVVISNLQMDVAFDAGKSSSNFVLSTVFRF